MSPFCYSRNFRSHGKIVCHWFIDLSRLDAIVSHMLCLSSSGVWGLVKSGEICLILWSRLHGALPPLFQCTFMAQCLGTRTYLPLPDGCNTDAIAEWEDDKPTHFAYRVWNYVQLLTVIDNTFSRLLGRNYNLIELIFLQPTPNFNTWCRQGSEGRLQIGYEETSS